jgi:hypothetical protein
LRMGEPWRLVRSDTDHNVIRAVLGADTVDRRQQLGDVVSVATGQRSGEQTAAPL